MVLFDAVLRAGVKVRLRAKEVNVPCLVFVFLVRVDVLPTSTRGRVARVHARVIFHARR